MIKQDKSILKFIIKMNDSYLSTQKKPPKGLTNHKSEFSFASPEEPTVQKSTVLLKESQLEKENRETQNLYTRLSKVVYTNEDLEALTNEHRIEVEKLLLEISRLHDVIYDMEKIKKQDIQKLKEQYEHMTYLHVNNIKNSQIAEMEVMDTQLRKYKEALTLKTEQYENLKYSNVRQKERLQSQVENLQVNLKEFVDRKNNEIFIIQEESEKQINHLMKEKEYSILQIRDLCDRQIKKLQRKLWQKQEDFGTIKQRSERTNEKNEELEKALEQDKIEVEKRILQIMKENERKRQDMSKYVQKMVSLEERNTEDQLSLQKEMFESEINNLINIVKLKDAENEKTLALIETQKIQLRRLTGFYEKENGELKEQMKKHRYHQLQEIQNLKTKMAILHQNDLKGLTTVYQTKIDGLNKEIESHYEQLVRARAYINEQTHRTYELKKKYDIKISKMNSYIVQLKSGMDYFQLQMKDKYENQRSAIIMTSKSLIGDTDLKRTNAKFYEEELRKLRKFIETLNTQLSNSQEECKQLRKYCDEEIGRLNRKVSEMEAEKSEAEEHWNSQMDAKNEEMRELNKTLNQLSNPIFEQDPRKEQIIKLEERIGEKEEKIRELELRCEDLQKNNSSLRGQNEQLYLENQVSHEDLKKDFDKIAEMQLKDMKDLYERKLKELEDDKEILKTRNSGQAEHIGELVRRYTQLQTGMKALTKQMKKRGELETRILNLGMDQNLVKNMLEVFERH